MKLLIVLLTLCFCTFAQAKSYSCEYENNGDLKKLEVSIDGKAAQLKIAGKEYKKCKVDKDEFGQLVDCSELDLDLMVLVNETQESTTGGIMSSTFDLFVDLEC